VRKRLEAIRPVLLLVLAAAGCRDGAVALNGGKAAAAPGPRGPADRVIVAEARVIAWPRTIRVQGSLMSDERVVVGTEVAGRVHALGVDTRGKPVDLGSEVRQGDVLARLEKEELALRVQQAESQLEQVRATLGLGKTDDDLQLDPLKVPSVVQEKAVWVAAQDNWNRGKALELETAISAEELEQRKSLVDVAAARYESALHGVNESIALLAVRRAELGLARQALQDADIHAPFDGVVEQRHVAPGAYLQVGQSVVTLVKVDPWRFRASVPEREATAVQVGQRVTIQVEGEQRVLEAVIARVSPSLEASSRALAIEAVQQSPADPPDSAAADERVARLRRGLFAEADVHVDPDASTLAVPRAAVREFAGVEKVWRVVDRQVAEQRVEVGRLNDAHAEILDGLAAGDAVVVEGFPKQAGPVEITQRQ